MGTNCTQLLAYLFSQAYEIDIFQRVIFFKQELFTNPTLLDSLPMGFFVGVCVAHLSSILHCVIALFACVWE